MGIDAAKVSIIYVIPSGGQVLNVESHVLVEGKHRTWVELSVCRKDWKPSYCGRKSRRAEGRWEASSLDIERQEAWAIEDGDWQFTVPVELGVPYADVEQIVLAIRRQQLINRLPTSIGPLRLNPVMPEIDPTEITWIRKTVSGYEVRTGRANGIILGVRIVNGTVELFSYGTWMAYETTAQHAAAAGR